MFTVGQEVSTKYGQGVVVCVGSIKPHVHVRMHSSSQVYILNMSQIAVAQANHPEMSTPDEVVEPRVLPPHPRQELFLLFVRHRETLTTHSEPRNASASREGG